MDNNDTPNSLIDEKSPYLLQHAYNPVKWYQWGVEAFERARQFDRPVFVSIGYSTCHWCHVMAHESFEDVEVAKLLNEYFICVKVDREERPDVDSVYMSVCQAVTGSGGWPLTIIMDADQRPFFAGTYIPKRSKFGVVGLMELLPAIWERWTHNRNGLTSIGDQICAYLNQERTKTGGNGNEDPIMFVKSAYRQLNSMFDEKNGGFGVAPKFPTPHQLLFLIKYYQLENDSRALEMAVKTLEQMYRGGIFDHIGGGFSRYSTDARWLVPHFEKMLYDNALLGLAYSETYAVTNDGFYRDVACRTFDYVLRELTDSEGGFYCAQDADSEGSEGKYYLFTPGEVKEALGNDGGKSFCSLYGITNRGNFEGKSIPNLLDRQDYRVGHGDMDALIKALYDYRLNRTSLHKDDKELASWNALMIASLARSSVPLDRESYLDASKSAQTMFEKRFVTDEGRLRLRWRDGEAAYDGHLDDYAFYAWALLELYRATYDVKYLARAVSISKGMVSEFYDANDGGFYLYAKGAEQLISRPKETYDGAMPSGNSVAALVLNRLWRLTGDSAWLDISQAHMNYIYGAMGDYPAGNTFALLAAMEVSYPSWDLLCACAEGNVADDLRDLLKKVTPNINVTVKNPLNERELEAVAPYTANYPLPEKGGRNTYYLCRDGACKPPCGIEALADILKDRKRAETMA